MLAIYPFSFSFLFRESPFVMQYGKRLAFSIFIRILE